MNAPVKYFLLLLFLLTLSGCQEKKAERIVEEETERHSDLSAYGFEKLSAYGFFKTPIKDLEPAEEIIPYQLNSPLFSDYAFKKRFLKIPAGTKAAYNADEVFDFPVGTVLIKNFYYPADFRKPESNLRILETRLLIKDEKEWKTLPYIWNEEQTEAYLEVAGKNIDVSWTHYDGSVKKINYSVPNMNQCKSCHLKGDKVVPIGPSARQLNRRMDRKEINQLSFLDQNKKLTGLPENFEGIPKLTSYEDKNASLDARARGWLDVNCAHCHRADGPAKTSGLHLLSTIKNPLELGIGKAPVAAGKGSGGLLYDIVPGSPEKSILYYRINSTDPGVMMPELGRQLVHEEGVELVRNWISSMK